MNEPARHLHAVDPTTGELIECPGCLARDDEIAGLQTELRAWRTRYAALKRDKQAEAQGDTLWGTAIALFTEWRIATGHMRSGWTADRFFLCQPYLREDGFDLCRYAVWGISAHPNRREVTKTYHETYDDWELVFRNRATFERYANRGAAIFGKDLPPGIPPPTVVPSPDP